MEKQESPFPNPPPKPEGEASPPGEKISAMRKQESSSTKPSSKLDGEVVSPSEELSAVVHIEQMRADVLNRQTDVSRLIIEAQNLADQRQFDYASRQLEYEKDIEEKRISTAGKIIWGLIGVAALPFFLVLLMFFFGNDANREGAKGLLVYGGTALAGWGAISAIKTAFSKILSRRNDQN